jgi:hypothetical protein
MSKDRYMIFSNTIALDTRSCLMLRLSGSPTQLLIKTTHRRVRFKRSFDAAARSGAFDNAALLQSKITNMLRAKRSTPSTSLTRQLSPAHQTALIGSFIATAKSNEGPIDLITGIWNNWTRHESTMAHVLRRHRNIPATTLASGKIPYQSLGRSTSHIPIKVVTARVMPTTPEIISSTATSLSASFFTESWRCSEHHEASNYVSPDLDKIRKQC